MTDWAILLLGVGLLVLVALDRRGIGPAWRKPARWWSRDPVEGFASQAPSQPLNLLLGILLGCAAVAYGVSSLL